MRKLFAVLAVTLWLGTALSQATIENFQPVSQETLENPAPGDWLMARNNYASWGHSALDQITPENVDQLTLAWASGMEPGPNEAEPLVYDGIMYLPNPNDVIQAFDAATGDLIWEYRRDLPEDLDRTTIAGLGNITRNIAIYEDKIFHATYDAHIIALDAQTGQLEWETPVGDPRVIAQTTGPIILDGKVVNGRACDPALPGGCFITAHDVESGEELWRTHTIPRPGEPGSETWGDLPLESRLHVGAWGQAGAFDPELNLIYWGTSVPAPSPEILRGTEGEDVLYSNSTLAINADTGEIEWYFQHLPRDNWDMDHPFERILVDSAIAPSEDDVLSMNPDVEPGTEYKVMTGIPGKTGVVWTLDRETGEFLWAKETVRQNVIESVSGSGEVTVNEDVIPDSIDDPYGLVCPTMLGGKNWMPGAYNPNTNAIYMPLQNMCMEPEISVAEWTPADLYGLSFNTMIAPGEENVGTVQAVSVETGETLWTFETRTGTMPLLSTGGNLIFGGDSARNFRALNAETGEVEWETRLSGSVSGDPISYSVDGEQYIAIPAGSGNAAVVGGYLALTPEVSVPNTGNTLYVFKLP
ncbi:MAG: PQQ-binding-like beta-propeller repeat protein [Trueperaceae bacterium]|nr:PQQ-binding-like beta-propeller repeat protein [Trueperaceae bacterium]